MFTEKDIKPISKYIEKLIFKLNKKMNKEYAGTSRFYSYLTKIKGELAKVTVACKSRGKRWYCKQVAVHCMHNEKCLVKDIEFFGIGGYIVGWFEQGLNKVRKFYENGYWETAPDKCYNPYAPVVNIKYALRFKRYKYSAVDLAKPDNVLKYLSLYEQYPHMEILVKFGLCNYVMSKTLLKKVAKDKKFRSWLLANRIELSINHFYISTLISAYKNNKPLKETQKFEEHRKTFIKHENYKNIKRYLEKDETKKFLEYLVKQETNIYSYSDYLKACEYLHLDMGIPKNKYPHNFKKWHDIRIDEYASAKALENERKLKELYTNFANIAEKYGNLERKSQENFIVLIAKNPQELINEGEVLGHCVGTMNYDQKFIRQESLIFFLRKNNNPTTPYVTLEYSLQNKKLLQCYGYNDSKPDQEVIDFAYKNWLPYANKQLKKIAM